MLPEFIIADLDRNRQVFHDLLAAATPEQYRFKPDPRAWCLLVVVCHLLDEELEDFRARVS